LFYLSHTLYDVLKGWGLLTDDILGLFVRAQSEENRLPNLIVQGPLGKLDLGDQDRLDPNTTFHDCRRDPLAPTSAPFLWQVYKRATVTPDPLQAGIELRQEFVGESGADSAGEEQPVRLIIADQQSAEVFPAPFGKR
jgi:hypothetical protein